MGLRLVAFLAGRFRIVATAHSAARCEALRRAGATPLVADLDDRASLHRLAGLAPTVVHLAPPPSHGADDRRTAALLSVLHDVERLVYVSTSGVYGDAGGAWIDETRAVAPTTARAARRVDAERRLRAWARDRGTRLAILRVPGIYATDRLPLARLEAGTPVIEAADDVYTNHIHADDLARIVVHALQRAAPQRVYHAVDDSAIRMGDWFDRVADAHGLPRPERVARARIGERIPANLLSFMSESRRLSNRRLRAELGTVLRYPTVDAGLAAAREKKGPHDGGPVR